MKSKRNKPFCFWEIETLSALWITYDHLYYAPWLASWAHFGFLVPAIYNRTSCAQVHELPQSHCCDNWEEGTLFSWMHIHVHTNILYSHIYVIHIKKFSVSLEKNLVFHYLFIKFDVAIATLENLLKMAVLKKRLNKTDMEKVG